MSVSSSESVEECFLNLVDKREWIPERVWPLIQRKYPGFHEWLNWRGGHTEPDNISDVELERQSRFIPDNTRRLVIQSVNESSWSCGTGMLGYTPWAFFLIHFIVKFDFVPGVLFAELGFGTLVQRFHRLWLQFLLVAFPRAGPEMGAAKHAAPFGLKTFKDFNMHLNTPFKVQLWAAMFQASMFCNRQALGDSRKFRHKWRPDWSLICNYGR